MLQQQSEYAQGATESMIQEFEAKRDDIKNAFILHKKGYNFPEPLLQKYIHEFNILTNLLNKTCPTRSPQLEQYIPPGEERRGKMRTREEDGTDKERPEKSRKR